MDLAGILSLLHGLAAFKLVAGLAERWVALSLAARESRITSLSSLMGAAEIFEQRMRVRSPLNCAPPSEMGPWAQRASTNGR